MNISLDKIIEQLIAPIFVTLVTATAGIYIEDNLSGDKMVKQMESNQELHSSMKFFFDEQKKFYASLNTQNQNIAITKKVEQPEKKEDLSDNSISKLIWKTALDISWLKKENVFGIDMEIDVSKYVNNLPLTISLVNLDSSNATVKITDQNNEAVVQPFTLPEQQSKVFNYKDQPYRFNLVDIRPTGFTKTLAIYFSIDKAQ